MHTASRKFLFAPVPFLPLLILNAKHCKHGSFPNDTLYIELKISCLIKSVFAKQEKFPVAEEKLKALKGTEELGFKAVVMLFFFFWVESDYWFHDVPCWN